MMRALTTWAKLCAKQAQVYDLLRPAYSAVPALATWVEMSTLEHMITWNHSDMTVIDDISTVAGMISTAIQIAEKPLTRLAAIEAAQWDPLSDYTRNATTTHDRDTTTAAGGTDTTTNSGTDTSSTTQDETSSDVYAMDQQSTPSPLTRTQHTDTSSTTYGGQVQVAHGRTTTGTDDSTIVTHETAQRSPASELIEKSLKVYDTSLVREIVRVIVDAIAVPIYLEEEETV